MKVREGENRDIKRRRHEGSEASGLYLTLSTRKSMYTIKTNLAQEVTVI